MKRITLAEFEAGIEAVLDEAGTTPVMIVKDGRDHLVLLPVGHYERLCSLARYFGTGEVSGTIKDRAAGGP
jgi:hypothetical protein